MRARLIQLGIVLAMTTLSPVAALESTKSPARMDFSGRLAGFMLPATSFCERVKFETGPDGLMSPSRSEERRIYLANLPQAQKTAILMLAGGLAGATAKTCVAPLERIKLLAQAGELNGGIIAGFKEVIAREGMGGLWRGNTVNVLRMVPNKGVLHATNDLYKEMAAGMMAGLPAAFVGAGTGTQFFLAGSLAGMTSVLVTYPLDLIRTRMAGRFVGSQTLTKGLMGNTWYATAATVVKTEGVSGLYRGVNPTLVGAFPYEGIKFYAYDKIKRALPHRADGTQRLEWKLVAGASAATVAHILTYPMDTVRRRMQLQGAGGMAMIYKSSWDCAKQMARKEGVISLYRGLTATCIRGVPNTGIQFAVYEGLKSLLQIATL
mmetsp:Transcript_32134/g.76197  ORF Transcript_32134/g.76197 Transcript_32134/m.76197 type:complete len:378 (-) Transcript_32134:190-1323(-)